MKYPIHITSLFIVLIVAATFVEAGTFSVLPLTGDADSTIATRNAYSLAIDVRRNSNITVNGAVFTGSAIASGTSNPTTNNYSFTNVPGSVLSGGTNSVTGNIGVMLNDFNYGGPTETLTLNNLRVGESYRTMFYNRSWSGPGGRTQTITTSDGGAINFDADAGAPGTGSLLKYDFVAQSNSLTFTFSEQNPTFSFHQYAFSNQMPNYGALLTDNFYAPSNPNTGNMNFNLAARQGGYYAGTAYTTFGNQQVGNNTGLVDGGNYLLSAFGGQTSPDRNFNGALSAGGQLIAFDVWPNIDTNDPSNWTAINLGLSQADRLNSVNTGVPHFGVLFRANGLLQAFDGNTNVTPIQPTWLPGGASGNALYRIELLLIDPTDGNPFDGVGQTDIQVFANGLPVYSFSKTGGGYANNYINFNSAFIGGIDNLLIARVPEPATIGVFAIGLCGLLAVRRRVHVARV